MLSYFENAGIFLGHVFKLGAQFPFEPMVNQFISQRYSKYRNTSGLQEYGSTFQIAEYVSMIALGVSQNQDRRSRSDSGEDEG